MKKLPALLFCLATALLLAACADMRTWDSTLNDLRGKPINDAVIVYGKPDGQYTKGAVTTYVWQDHKTESVFGPTVTQGPGYRIGRAPYENYGDFLWSGIRYETCVIRADTVNGLITRITSEGNPGDCERIHGFRHDELGHDYSSGHGHAL